MPFVTYECQESKCKWKSEPLSQPVANCFLCGSPDIKPEKKSLEAAQKESAAHIAEVSLTGEPAPAPTAPVKSPAVSAAKKKES